MQFPGVALEFSSDFRFTSIINGPKSFVNPLQTPNPAGLQNSSHCHLKLWKCTENFLLKFTSLPTFILKNHLLDVKLAHQIRGTAQ